MDHNTKTLAKLEEILVQEGEDGPVLCIHGHEVAIAQAKASGRLRPSGRVGLPLIDGIATTSTEQILHLCPYFGHRTCAHRDNLGTNVYEDEIEMLHAEGLIDAERYYALREQNNTAIHAVGRLDSYARTFAKENVADPKKFFEQRKDLEERHLATWKNIVNPLRKELLGVLRGRARKAS